MPAEEVALVVHPASIVQVELEAECRLCDAPAWDAATGRLLFVDITSKEIHSYDPRLKTHGRLPQPFLKDRRWLCCSTS